MASGSPYEFSTGSGSKSVASARAPLLVREDEAEMLVLAAHESREVDHSPMTTYWWTQCARRSRFGAWPAG